MWYRRPWIQGIAVFAVAAAWFAFLIPWNGFSDPDAFYHAKASLLVWQSGPIRAYPWLDLTLLGAAPADLHFLFHLVAAPFAKVFGMFQGLRILTVLLSAGAITAFFFAARSLRIRWPLAWSALLLVSHGFVIRLLLGKATPLAVLLYVVGLWAAWKRRPWILACVAAAYALSHGGWIYLAGSVALLAFGDVLYSFLVENRSIRASIAASPWRTVIAAFIGAVAGLLLHPNFPTNLRLAWTQVVTIGLETPFRHVILGNEWLPSEPLNLLGTLAPWIIAALIGLLGLFFAARKPLDANRARLLQSLGLILAVLVGLTFKSQRSIEFLVPVLALWVGTLWSLVDVREFGILQMSPLRRGIVVGLFLILLFRHAFGAWDSLHPPSYSDDAYAAVMSAISERAQPGDRVFHTSWDEFPMLFARDDRLKYIVGLDPTFLYVASSTLSDDVRDLTCSQCRGVMARDIPLESATATREEARSLIHDRLGSRFIFVSKKNHANFLDLVRKDTRFVQLVDEPDSAAFEVRP